MGRGKEKSEKNGAGVTVSSSKGLAEEVRSVILKEGLFDPARSIGRDEEVHFPVLLPEGRDMEWLMGLFGRTSAELTFEEGPGGTRKMARRETPFQQAREMLASGLSEREIALLPNRWEMLGDCLVLKVDPLLLPSLERIAEVYMGLLHARYSILDQTGVHGELRLPSTRVIVPPPDGDHEVVHRENGIVYRLDPRDLMFSSGNIEERTTVRSIIDNGPKTPRERRTIEDGGTFKGEMVLDMFAGIGYFTLPMASSPNVERVVAVEKNPRAFHYLCRNMFENKVEGKVVPVLGDNRASVPAHCFDRIMMGYVGSTSNFLRNAFDYIRPEGAMVHFHDKVGIEKGAAGSFKEMVKEHCPEGLEVELISSRKVKSYAPRVDHICLDLLVQPRGRQGIWACKP